MKKLSQQAFADDFGLTRANIGSYEEGRAEPKIAIVVEIANKFGVSVESLLNNELKVNDIINYKADEKLVLNSKKVSPDEQGNEIPLISASNYAGYIENEGSVDFVSILPKVLIPGYKHKASRAIEVANNELIDRSEGVFEKDILICIKRDANIISNLIEGEIYAVLVRGHLYLRRLVFGMGCLELHTDNRFYAPIEVFPEDVKEIWQANTIISSKGGVLQNKIPIYGKSKGSLNDN
ncbi:MAG: XRE family transcriptional regulator [Bacteroidia bacterium]